MAADSLTVETFLEYSLGMCFLLLRLYARIKYVGLRYLGLSDALAIMAMIFWTMQTVIIHLLSIYGNNIGLNEQTAMQVPETKVADMILGSKLAFMNWMWYLCYIWCLKGVLLCLYHKMTDGTSWHRLVHAAAALCVVTWLACMLTHICVCTPIPRNWQIKPYPGDNCTLRKPNYVVIAVLNVISDLACLIIPIPILAKLQIPFARKLVLVVMFSSGFFIMICTILRAYYSLKSISTLAIALGWADRECFVAAIVASLPGIKPLFRNTAWFDSTNRGKSSGKPTGAYASFGSKLPGTNKTYVSSFGKDTDRFELIDRQEKNLATQQSSAGESVEQILPPDESHDPQRITFTREYILEEGRASPGPGNR